MGTRRGAQRQAESDAFEAANPFLTRVETTFEVVRIEDEWSEHCDPDTVPAPLVEQDGQEVMFDVDDFDPGSEISFAEDIETPIGELETDGEEYSELSMSDYGFGVASDGDDEEMDEFTLNDDETLEFDIYALMRREFVEEGEGTDQGGVSFEVEYMVLGGNGQIGLALFDYNYEKEMLAIEEEGAGDVEVMSGFLSTGDSGSFKATAMDGTLFEEAIVYVDGSLQVAITGISVVTNFEGDFIASR